MVYISTKMDLLQIVMKSFAFVILSISGRFFLNGKTKLIVKTPTQAQPSITLVGSDLNMTLHTLPNTHHTN